MYRFKKILIKNITGIRHIIRKKGKKNHVESQKIQNSQKNPSKTKEIINKKLKNWRHYNT
jgi:hypothetical protein